MIINIIAWIVFGVLVGWVASLVLGSSNRSQELISYVIVGAAGASLGGFIMNQTTTTSTDGLVVSNLLVAVIGSVLFIALAKGFNRAR